MSSTSSLTRLAAALTAAVALSTALPALADHGRGGPDRMQPPTAAQVAERLSTLKYALRITPAQEGAWSAYESQLRKQQTEHEARMKALQERRAKGERPSATERDQWRAQAEADRSARQKAHDALYAALNAEQKRVADLVLRPHGDGARDARGDRDGRGHDRHDRRGDRDERGGRDGFGRPAAPASAPGAAASR
ncbi:Spy/CpxP family protein refolding chaperone [Pseudaquabacterium rugosum]|uniref:Spy/CpxP family protein refolding chaperone n=1 Tax=Pseudaquabacterium rugosum TaxID=2984194 RepID=A0ABU9B3J3_9BURK